jgi:hypothetical protein
MLTICVGKFGLFSALHWQISAKIRQHISLVCMAGHTIFKRPFCVMQPNTHSTVTTVTLRSTAGKEEKMILEKKKLTFQLPGEATRNVLASERSEDGSISMYV